jgi:hypothetical protein
MIEALNCAHSIRKLSNTRFFLSACILVLVGLLVYAAWSQGSLQWNYRLHFPYRDMVVITMNLDANPTPSLNDLFRMNSANEHRMILPYYFYLWDRNYFAASGELLYRAIYIFNAVLIMSLLWSAAHLQSKLRTPYVVLFVASVVYWFFAGFNWDNLTWQVQVNVMSCLAYLSVALILSSLVSTADDSERRIARDAPLAALVGVLCLAATYSFGAGLVGWPVIMAHAIATRWRLAPLMIFGAFAAFTIGSYGYWYFMIANFEGNAFHTSFGSALGHPVRLAIFVLDVLAWPPSFMFEGLLQHRFARWLMLAVSLGAFALAVSWVILIYFARLRYGRKVRPASFHAAMLVVVALGMTLLAALSRSGAMSGSAQSRYGVFASIFWCALVGLLLLELRDALARRCLVAFAILTVIMAYAPSRLYERVISDTDQKVFQAGVLATLGLEADEAGILGISTTNPAVFTMWRAPRVGGPTYAEREPFKWIGHSLADLPQARTSDCLGEAEVESLEGEPRLLTVGGWIVGSTVEADIRWILLADDADVVVGAGKPGLPSPDVLDRLDAIATKAASGPADYARFEIVAAADPQKPLFVWGIDSRGNACPVGSVKRG